MKRILIEMEKLKNPNSGLGQFCLNIGEQFQLLNPKNLQLDFYLPAFQKNVFGEQFNYVKHTSIHKLIPLGSSDYDVWHCLQQDSPYLPTNKKTRLILTIHDLNFLQEKKKSKAGGYLKKLQKNVDRASAITVISDYTKKLCWRILTLKINPFTEFTMA